MKVFLKNLKPKDIIIVDNQEVAEVMGYGGFFKRTNSFSFTVKKINGTWATVSGSETMQIEIKER